MDTNTFIDPITNFILSSPPETVYRWVSNLTEAACNLHPTAQKVCKQIVTLVPDSLKTKRPNALILTASSDHNGALALTFFQPDVFEFKQIERTHNAKYKSISDIPSLCRAIDEEKANGIAIDVLIIRAHGERRGMQLDNTNNLTIYDPLPKKSCLQNLAPKATIILESCSTGQGFEELPNVANHIAYYSPKESTVIAPTIPITHFKMRSENARDVEFPNVLSPTSGYPTIYKIDPSNRKEALRDYPSERDENSISNITERNESRFSNVNEFDTDDF